MMMAGCCCAEACTAAVINGVMRLPGCRFDGAWCLVCEVCRLTIDWVDCTCFLSFVFLGGARRLELSPCSNRQRGSGPHRSLVQTRFPLLANYRIEIST